MITTAQEFLKTLSYALGEPVPDYSPTRLTYFNRAYQYYLSLNNWSFKIKSYTLTTTEEKEYDLTSLISDYSQADGIHEVKTNNGKVIDPIDYESKDLTTELKYYLTPDGKEIGFTSCKAGDVFTIYYYAVLTPVSSETENLNIPIPEDHKEPIITYLKFLVHERKRQRNDARNCMLDFKEQLEEARVKDACKKNSGFLPRIFPPIRQIVGI